MLILFILPGIFIGDDASGEIGDIDCTELFDGGVCKVYGRRGVVGVDLTDTGPAARLKSADFCFTIVELSAEVISGGDVTVSESNDVCFVTPSISSISLTKDDCFPDILSERMRSALS